MNLSKAKFDELTHDLVELTADVYKRQVDGQREDKPGSMFPDTVSIIVKGNPIPYVSRGGLKLAKAVDAFGLKLEMCIRDRSGPAGKPASAAPSP